VQKLHTYKVEAKLNDNNKRYYQKCKEEARELLYESMEDRVRTVEQ
jgi:hypothetical protein